MVAASKSFLADSPIIIDHLSGIAEATDFLRENHATICLSVITRAEVLAGAERKDVGVIKRFLGEFSTLEITVAIADSAADLRREHGWKLPDALQAAVALAHRLSLVTRDTKDFPPQRHSFVMVPYRLRTT
jgi:predicted nucleic acid-binding protein